MPIHPLCGWWVPSTHWWKHVWFISNGVYCCLCLRRREAVIQFFLFILLLTGIYTYYYHFFFYSIKNIPQMPRSVHHITFILQNQISSAKPHPVSLTVLSATTSDNLPETSHRNTCQLTTPKTPPLHSLSVTELWFNKLSLTSCNPMIHILT